MMVTCQACGTENPPDATFCSKCARKLDVETQQAVVEQRAAHTATGIRWPIVIATIVALVLIVLLLVLLATHTL
jgi:uncharacterized membrane protein YvbJ